MYKCIRSIDKKKPVMLYIEVPFPLSILHIFPIDYWQTGNEMRYVLVYLVNAIYSSLFTDSKTNREWVRVRPDGNFSALIQACDDKMKCV